MPLVARTRTRASEGFMGTPSLRFSQAQCVMYAPSGSECPARRWTGSSPRREDGKASPHCQAPWLDHRYGPFERQGGKHV